MKSVYEYLDYREYMKDFYDEEKRKRPLYFSYRYLAKRIGVDASLIAKIVMKKKHISMNSAAKYCSYRKMSIQQQTYFTLLVQYAKAKGLQDRTYYLEKLATVRPVNFESLDATEQDLLSHWQPISLWVLMNSSVPVVDPELLRSHFIPFVPEGKLAESIKVLQQLGMVEKLQNGAYRKIPRTLFIDDFEQTAAIKNLKKEIAALARKSISGKDVESVISKFAIVKLSEKSISVIKRRLTNLVKEILTLAGSDEESNKVYHFAFHGFPVTSADKSGCGTTRQPDLPLGLPGEKIK